MLNIGLSKVDVLRAHVALVVSIHCVNAVTLWLRYVSEDFPGRDTFVQFFSVSSEGKFPTWFSGVTLVACGLLLALIGWAKYRNRDTYRMHWLLLSAIFFYISFDEVTSVHEEVGPILGDALGVTGAVLSGWVVPASICIVVLGLVYVRFLLRLPPRSRLLFLIAGSVYVAGALGLEFVGNAYVGANGRDLGYGIIATIEEVLEMGGIVVFVYALLDYLEAHVSSRISVTLS
jgi:hypothetical protein